MICVLVKKKIPSQIGDQGQCDWLLTNLINTNTSIMIFAKFRKHTFSAVAGNHVRVLVWRLVAVALDEVI